MNPSECRNNWQRLWFDLHLISWEYTGKCWLQCLNCFMIMSPRMWHNVLDHCTRLFLASRCLSLVLYYGLIFVWIRLRREMVVDIGRGPKFNRCWKLSTLFSFSSQCLLLSKFEIIWSNSRFMLYFTCASISCSAAASWSMMQRPLVLAREKIQLSSSEACCSTHSCRLPLSSRC